MPIDTMMQILRAMTGTLALVSLTLVISTLIGLALTPLSVHGPAWLKIPLYFYSWLGRALPPLTLLFAAYYGLSFAGIMVGSLTAATIAFVFFSTAYMIEIFRGAYIGIPRGQAEAGRALGLPAWRLEVQVLFPQMLRLAVPAYITNATTVLKESSLASLVGVLEITAVTVRAVQARPDDALILFAYLGLLYLFLGSILIGGQHYFERRFG